MDELSPGRFIVRGDWMDGSRISRSSVTIVLHSMVNRMVRPRVKCRPSLQYSLIPIPVVNV
jgi:hypothetical protein